MASLNHPHICAIHDVSHQDGVDLLVMEYLESETLADRLGKGKDRNFKGQVNRHRKAGVG